MSPAHIPSIRRNAYREAEVKDATEVREFAEHATCLEDKCLLQTRHLDGRNDQFDWAG
jgi:hypothetical protein